MLATLYLIPVFDLYELRYAKDGATSASRTYRCDKYSISDLVLVKKRTVNLMEGTICMKGHTRYSSAIWAIACRLGSSLAPYHTMNSHDRNIYLPFSTRVETRADNACARPPEIKQKNIK
jgi:hypothetical protein